MSPVSSSGLICGFCSNINTFLHSPTVGAYQSPVHPILVGLPPSFPYRCAGPGNCLSPRIFAAVSLLFLGHRVSTAPIQQVLIVTANEQESTGTSGAINVPTHSEMLPPIQRRG